MRTKRERDVKYLADLSVRSLWTFPILKHVIRNSDIRIVFLVCELRTFTTVQN